jgi:hypothetical protein
LEVKSGLLGLFGKIFRDYDVLSPVVVAATMPVLEFTVSGINPSGCAASDTCALATRGLHHHKVLLAEKTRVLFHTESATFSTLDTSTLVLLHTLLTLTFEVRSTLHSYLHLVLETLLLVTTVILKLKSGVALHTLNGVGALGTAVHALLTLESIVTEKATFTLLTSVSGLGGTLETVLGGTNSSALLLSFSEAMERSTSALFAGNKFSLVVTFSSTAVPTLSEWLISWTSLAHTSHCWSSSILDTN